MNNLYGAYKTVERHLYNSENWSQTQLDVFTTLYGLPPWKYLSDVIYGKRENAEWREHNPDIPIHDPRNLPGTSSIASGVAGGLNFVSSNVTRLYRR